MWWPFNYTTSEEIGFAVYKMKGLGPHLVSEQDCPKASLNCPITGL